MLTVYKYAHSNDRLNVLIEHN